MSKQLLDTRSAAAQLDIKKNTLEKWRMLSKGPPFIRIGRKIRYSRADIEAWRMSRRVEPEAVAP